ncbi:hypothetical protein DFH27DRAFT_616675 [Peziza echinospora]|nr:hypothetical protein DFH27DRAFT_616675 [Peziza echinospora]
MAVWSHVVHNSTNHEVEVLEAGANDSGRQTMCGTTPPIFKLKSWELVQTIQAVKWAYIPL